MSNIFNLSRANSYPNVPNQQPGMMPMGGYQQQNYQQRNYGRQYPNKPMGPRSAKPNNKGNYQNPMPQPPQMYQKAPGQYGQFPP